MQYIITLDAKIEEQLRIGINHIRERYEIDTLPGFTQEFIYGYLWHCFSHACIFGWSDGIRYHEFYTEAEGYVELYNGDFGHHFIEVINDLSQGNHAFVQLFEEVLNNLRASYVAELDDVLPDVLMKLLPSYGWFQLLADSFYELLRAHRIETIENVDFYLDRHIAIVTA